MIGSLKVWLSGWLRGLGESALPAHEVSATILVTPRFLAGCLLRDATLQSRLALTFSNLAILTGDLNRYGLLYKPKPPKEKSTTANVAPGKRW